MTVPGVTGDHIAITECTLCELREKLPFGTCVIGDAACDATEHMVPIHQNLDRMKPICDDFNCCASQMRIRVEMAFGMMQMKWGILQRPLGAKSKNICWMIQAIGRLHDFCVNEQLLATAMMKTLEWTPTKLPPLVCPPFQMMKMGTPSNSELSAMTTSKDTLSCEK